MEVSYATAKKTYFRLKETSFFTIRGHKKNCVDVAK
jgi:hypothetical protein